MDRRSARATPRNAEPRDLPRRHELVGSSPELVLCEIATALAAFLAVALATNLLAVLCRW